MTFHWTDQDEQLHSEATKALREHYNATFIVICTKPDEPGAQAFLALKENSPAECVSFLIQCIEHLQDAMLRLVARAILAQDEGLEE